MNKEKINPFAVSQICVEKLFGQYTYNIPNDSNVDINKLLILYGDNGTGKTSILKLLFYLISPRDKKGYKTKIAKTKFQKLSIHFQNGTEIGALRENSLIGSFEYYISKNGKILKSVILKADSENTINLENESEVGVKFLAILDYIKKLNITIFYLSDDRKILNSHSSAEHEDDETEDSPRIFFNTSELSFANNYETNLIRNIVNEKKIALEPTINRLSDWVNNKIISGSRTGERNSQAIVNDIIKDYIKLAETEPTKEDKDSLLKDLDNLDNKMPSYVSLGLIDGLDTNPIRASLKKAKTPEQIKFLRTVIKPYLDGINAKLNALENVEKTIKLFVDTVNDYFNNKVISYNLITGFTIKQKNGDNLEFNWLSSGEKQLLLLLINTVTATDAGTIFIIDEPEISLNIKWQRKLIKTLLTFSSNRNIQFILATHSFEVLSAYKNNITKLEDKNA